MTEKITAKLNYLKITPRKVRLIANTLKGLSTQEAQAQLLIRRQRAAKPLLKLLNSAVANAKNIKNIDQSKLFIKDLRVDQGPMLKRFLPRAMGRATPIHKKMSHITLVLDEGKQKFINRFTIIPPPKKEKTKKEVKPKAPKTEELKTEKPKEKGGFFKKIFRRKAV
jgi:large subunit ribosomal protein L22